MMSYPVDDRRKLQNNQDGGDTQLPNTLQNTVINVQVVELERVASLLLCFLWLYSYLYEWCIAPSSTVTEVAAFW